MGFSLLWALLSLVAFVSAGLDPKVLELQQEADQYRKDIKSDPSNVTAILGLATTLQGINHIRPDGGKHVAEALWAYRKALEFPLTPIAETIVLGNMGALYMGLGDADRSLETMDMAIKVAFEAKLSNDAISSVLFNRGKALSMNGDTEQSEKAYAEAIGIARFHDTSSYAKSFAAAQKVPRELGTELQCAAAYLTGELDAGCGEYKLEWLSKAANVDRSWLFFAAFKALQQENKSVAWKYLKLANDIQHADSHYNPQGEEAGAKMIMSVFNPAAFIVPSGHRDATPIFVVGMPRSGSTLIEQLLASHSTVYAAGEDTPLAPIVGELMDRVSHPDANQYQVFIDMGKKYVQQVNALVSAETDRKIKIVDKMLKNVWNIGYIHLMLPGACIIHAARHPLDAGLSCYIQPFEGRGTPWAWDLTEIGQEYKLVENLMRHWSAVLPRRVLKVHYEALVHNFEGQARRIFSHCGLEWEEQVREFYKTKRTVLTASVAQVRQELYTTSVGKWREFSEELEPLKAELGDFVREYEEELNEVIRMGNQKDEL